MIDCICLFELIIYVQLTVVQSRQDVFSWENLKPSVYSHLSCYIGSTQHLLFIHKNIRKLERLSDNDFLVTVKAAPHECVISNGQP